MDARKRIQILTACCAASGAAGLIHELVWTRRLELLLGTSVKTAAASLAVTMGGMALGAHWAGAREKRRREGAAAYGAYEVLLAVYCLLLPFLTDWAAPLFRLGQGLTGDGPMLARTAVGMLLVLPAAFLMGATFPPLVADSTRAQLDDAEAAVGRLYGANLMGAFLGVVAGGFVLRPALGTRGTLIVAAALSLGAGVVAWVLRQRPTSAPATGRSPTPSLPEVSPGARSAVFAVYALSGCAGLAYQVLLHRMASLWIGGSSYAFASVLAAFLLGLSLGSFSISKAKLTEAGGPWRHLARLQWRAALWALGLGLVAGKIPLILSRFMSYEAVPFPVLLGLEFTGIALLVLPGAHAMGASLPTAAACLGIEEETSGELIGRLYAVNAMGCVLGALGCGHLLVPAFGLRGALIGVAVVNLVAGLVADGAGARPLKGLATAGAFAAALLCLPAWDAAILSSGPFIYAKAYRDSATEGRSVEDVIRACGEVLFHRDGAFATTTVRKAFGGLLSLQVNGKTDASNKADQFTQTFIAHLPMLARPESKRALCVGLGSGVTAGAFLRHPLERLDVVEIAPEVVEASRYFDELTGAPLDDPRTHLYLDDARSFVSWTDATYDIVMSEPSNPWLAGIANLFTREYFTRCRDRLAEDGVMVQWVQAYSTSPDDFRSVLGTFQSVFPRTLLFRSANETDFVLLGVKGGPALDATDLVEQLGQPTAASVAMARDGLDAGAFARCFVADPEEVARLAEGRPLVTDDHPFLEFTAPANLYHDQGPLVREQLAQVDSLEAARRAFQNPEPIVEYLTRRQGALKTRQLAFAQAVRGEHDAAREKLEETLEVLPGDEAALDVYALLVMRQAEGRCAEGDHLAAAELYSKVLRRKPQDLDARNNRAHCLADAGDFLGARSELEAVIALAPDHNVAYRNLSSVLYELDEVEGALNAYLRSLNGVKPDAAQWKNLGELYRELGDFPHAALAWARSLEADPDQEDLREVFDLYVEVAGSEGIAKTLGSGA